MEFVYRDFIFVTLVCFHILIEVTLQHLGEGNVDLIIGGCFFEM